MRPEDQPDGRVGTPQVPKRTYVGAPPQRSSQSQQQAAAADLVRSQIDTIFGGDQPTTTAQPTAQPVPSSEPRTAPPVHAPARQQPVAQQQQAPLEDTNPYERTRDDAPNPQREEWTKYQSAWQDYYQKYYEGYYAHHVEQMKQQITTKQSLEATQPASIFSKQPVEEPASTPEDGVTTDEALFKLRQKLLGKVQSSAKSVRKSRHFIPIAAALVVMLLFVFLQYNQVLIANVKAYVSPGTIDPQNIVVDPTTNMKVGPESRLIIPKINVDTPVHYDVGIDHKSQMLAMENGVAHFPIPGANSKPGQIGNTVLSGHSSNDVFAAGDYKFIFAQLEKLTVGDTIYANYNETRYTYIITKTEVVLPTEVGKLVYPTTKPVLTLITCTPLGTALKRLLITAEQVSPDPATSAPAEAPPTDNTDTVTIPGSEPTFVERLFGRS